MGESIGFAGVGGWGVGGKQEIIYHNCQREQVPS